MPGAKRCAYSLGLTPRRRTNTFLSTSTLEEYRQHLQSYGLPEFSIQHFLAVAVDYQNGIFSGVNGVIGQVTAYTPNAFNNTAYCICPGQNALPGVRGKTSHSS